MNTLKYLLVACVVSALALVPVIALAHRVNVFAWLEDGVIHVQASFSRKSPARQSAVTVLRGTDGSERAVLLNGTTDDTGRFSFAQPAEAHEHGLTIRVNAGQGHQNDWTMKAGEFSTVRAQGIAAASPVPTPIGSVSTPDEGGPRLQDIVGGLGWIVGLTGIGMAVYSKKRRPKS